MKDLKQQILNKPNRSELPIKIVAIDGHGGSGKSTLAAKLAKELNAEVINQDDFASWDNPLDWWPRVIKEVFEPIKKGAKTIRYQPSSWGTDHKPGSVEHQIKPIMILEGVSSARKEFRPYISFAIWVDTPIEICLERGLERDGEDALKQWQQWMSEEDEYIKRDKPQEFADMTVSGKN